MRTLRTTIDGETVIVSEKLVRKYSGPVPRYTSYPPIPNWNKNFGAKDFQTALQKSNAKAKPLSLYLHIPFCEERCTFCACNAIATHRHEAALPYLDCLKKEIAAVASCLDHKRPLIQIHWGGGTPTYLSAAQIEELFNTIQKHFLISSDAEISIEVDPRVTSLDQLTLLKSLGFNRISLGVQDVDPAVQEAIGRIQPPALTQKIIAHCRKLGMRSIHCDLIYGLPNQTQKSFEKSLVTLLELNPDRVSLFHFAYLPKMFAHQRKIDPTTLPDHWTKLLLFCRAIETFQKAGYAFLGLDHFSRQSDPLALAQREKNLFRSFQGHSKKMDVDLIGLGVTGISEVNGTFAQNERRLSDYQRRIGEEGFATHLGLTLTEEDKIRQKIIGEIMCNLEFKKSPSFDADFAEEMKTGLVLEEEGLIKNTADAIRVTPLGRLFLRNVASLFDPTFRFPSPSARKNRAPKISEQT